MYRTTHDIAYEWKMPRVFVSEVLGQFARRGLIQNDLQPDYGILRCPCCSRQHRPSFESRCVYDIPAQHVDDAKRAVQVLIDSETAYNARWTATAKSARAAWPV